MPSTLLRGGFIKEETGRQLDGLVVSVLERNINIVVSFAVRGIQINLLRRSKILGRF